MKKVLSIKGMSCEHCQKHVQTVLDAIPGVKAKVYLAKNEAVVTVDSSVSDDALKQAVTEAGYEVSDIQEKKGLFS